MNWYQHSSQYAPERCGLQLVNALRVAAKVEETKKGGVCCQRGKRLRSGPWTPSAPPCCRRPHAAIVRTLIVFNLLKMKASTQRCPSPEILYSICLQVLIRYIDDLITGPLALQPPTETSIDLTKVRLEDDELAVLRSEIEQNDVSLSSVNPAVALLRSSFQLRATTLLVLSRLLDIKLEGPEAGIQR